MSDLKITPLKIDVAKHKNWGDYEISLKRDGCFMYYIDGMLISSRKVIRSDRFKHILDILNANAFKNCYGEMYIEGGNVFDVSRSENWKRAKFMPINLFKSGLTDEENQEYIQQKVKEISSAFITEKITFNDINEGWEYVLNNNCEGLVLKHKYSDELFKIKLLQEAKVEIKSHEAGSEKGTFILIDDNRISGTSREFIVQYLDIKSKGEKPIAECEYQFLTKANKMFQPRLRRIYSEGKECQR